MGGILPRFVLFIIDSMSSAESMVVTGYAAAAVPVRLTKTGGCCCWDDTRIFLLLFDVTSNAVFVVDDF